MCDSNTYNECIEIIEDKKTLKHKDLEVKWQKFITAFPTLYKILITTDDIDLNLINYMCTSALKKNLLPEKEKIETDFDVGDKLAHKYIYDKFPEPNDQQKTFIKDVLRKKINNKTPINPDAFCAKSEKKSEN